MQAFILTCNPVENSSFHCEILITNIYQQLRWLCRHYLITAPIAGQGPSYGIVCVCIVTTLVYAILVA